MDQPAIVRVIPRTDPAPVHTCGTLFRAGVATIGCPGCAGRLHRLAVAFRAPAVTR